LSQLLGGTGEDFEAVEDTYEELMEFEEGGWVIVNLPDNGLLSAPQVDPLENLLIEHPSMSVYQMRSRMSGEEEEEEEEEELNSDEDEEDTSRPVAVGTHISWRLAAWGIPLPCNVQLLAVQRARTQAERKRLSRAPCTGRTWLSCGSPRQRSATASSSSPASASTTTEEHRGDTCLLRVCIGSCLCHIPLWCSTVP
ncbi:hypothetical protein INR49_028777, partial [Caranx melampygus]